MTGDPALGWNLIRDIRQLFEYEFMVNALEAGSIVSLCASLIGWFMVLRRQTFAGHTLAVVGFPGAAGAVLIGVSATYGYFAFATAAALAFAAVSSRSLSGSRDEPALIGTIQAFALGLGFLFVSLSHTNLAGSQALLFGSFLGVTHSQVQELLVLAVAALAVLAIIARPLVFASVDPEVAAARGVKVRLLNTAFLLLLGVATAEASQITGTLLVFALLVLPAATAEAITARPGMSILLAAAIALSVTWVGLALSYYKNYPVGFPITSLAFAAFVLAHLAHLALRRLSLPDAVSMIPLVSDMFSHPFMRFAFIAGSAIALNSGCAGYFLLLRSQVFVADALSHVAFTGALAALAFGIDLRLGLFAGTVGVALLLGALGPRGRADDVIVGSVFAWILGLGVLFLSLFTSSRSTRNGAAAVRVLFGSIYGLDASQAWLAAGLAVAGIVVLLLVARPLLFATVDELVAGARGVPVRGLGFLFLALVGLAAAEASQAVGALLILGLMAAPAGAAHRLTARPYLAMALSGTIALLSVWCGLTLSYVVGQWPPSFSILAVATSVYALVLLWAPGSRAVAAAGRRFQWADRQRTGPGA